MRKTNPSNKVKQLLVAYRNQGDRFAGDQLILAMDKLVWKVVHRFDYLNLTAEDKQDLFQVGRMGVMKAIDAFNVNSGNEFSTYAYTKIFREVTRQLNDLMHHIRLPYGQVARLQKYVAATEQYMELVGCKISHKEYVMQVMGLKEYQYWNLHEMTDMSNVVSLDMSLTDEEGALTVADRVSTEQVTLGFGVDLDMGSPEQMLIQTEEMERLEELCQGFTPEEERVIAARLLDGGARRKMTSEEKRILKPLQERLRGLI